VGSRGNDTECPRAREWNQLGLPRPGTCNLYPDEDEILESRRRAPAGQPANYRWRTGSRIEVGWVPGPDRDLSGRSIYRPLQKSRGQFQTLRLRICRATPDSWV